MPASRFLQAASGLLPRAVRSPGARTRSCACFCVGKKVLLPARRLRPSRQLARHVSLCAWTAIAGSALRHACAAGGKRPGTAQAAGGVAPAGMAAGLSSLERGARARLASPPRLLPVNLPAPGPGPGLPRQSARPLRAAVGRGAARRSGLPPARAAPVPRAAAPGRAAGAAPPAAVTRGGAGAQLFAAEGAGASSGARRPIGRAAAPGRTWPAGQYWPRRWRSRWARAEPAGPGRARAAGWRRSGRGHGVSAAAAAAGRRTRAAAAGGAARRGSLWQGGAGAARKGEENGFCGQKSSPPPPPRAARKGCRRGAGGTPRPGRRAARHGGEPPRVGASPSPARRREAQSRRGAPVRPCAPQRGLRGWEEEKGGEAGAGVSGRAAPARRAAVPLGGRQPGFVSGGGGGASAAAARPSRREGRAAPSGPGGERCGGSAARSLRPGIRWLRTNYLTSQRDAWVRDLTWMLWEILINYVWSSGSFLSLCQIRSFYSSN